MARLPQEDSKKKSAEPERIDAQLLNPDSDLPPDADLEERFFDFWKRYGGLIFGGLAVAALGAVSYQLWQMWSARQAREEAAAYLAATTPEAKIAFAREHEGAPQAGLALLSVADGQFDAGDFTNAVTAYQNALDQLTDQPLLQARARLCLALANYRAGNAEAALASLAEMAQSPSALEGYRAEAAYNLAVLRWERGDVPGANQALDIIGLLENSPLWQHRAETLRQRMPPLITDSAPSAVP